GEAVAGRIGSHAATAFVEFRVQIKARLVTTELRIHAGGDLVGGADAAPNPHVIEAAAEPGAGWGTGSNRHGAAAEVWACQPRGDDYAVPINQSDFRRGIISAGPMMPVRIRIGI